MQFEPSEDVPHSVLRMCAPHDSLPVGGALDVGSWQPRNHDVAEKLSHKLIFQQIYITMNIILIVSPIQISVSDQFLVYCQELLMKKDKRIILQ